MLLIELAGGLGNQMFQYAAARALANRLEDEVALDVRSFEQNASRQFELHRWLIGARIATANELRRFPIWGAKIARRLKMVALPGGYYFEPSFGFDPNFFEIAGSARLSGYFQSESYFLEHRESLLREFVPRASISRENASLVKKISGCSAVSIHVRRGDYISDKRAQAVHGLCNVQYYNRAIEIVSEHVADATYLFFSDDMQWAKENIQVPGDIVYVSGNEGHPEMDIYLMSLCKHNICANSSFSWWGAWMNQNPDKIVLAPRRWFASGDIDTSHLIPRQWRLV